MVGLIISIAVAVIVSILGRNYRCLKFLKDRHYGLENASLGLYFEGLSKFVEIIRTKVPQDSYIQNEIDNVVNLVESTKYKLKFLH